MKKIEAFIKRPRLEPVARVLHHIDGLSGMTATDAQGFGRGRAGHQTRSGIDAIRGYIEVVRIEVFCSDGFADEVVSAIRQAAHTGLRGDGKVYILPVHDAVRISTGDRGEDAV